jgi:CBS domain-containing protein
MICPYCQHDNIQGADECANCGQSLYGLDLPEAGRKYASPPFLRETLGRLPHSPVSKVGVHDPVGLAVRRMQQGDTAAVLVMDGERLAGIITSWDILHKVAGFSNDLNSVTCAQIMTPDPVVFHDDDSIVLAINKMSSGDFRHIPIVGDDGPVSVIDVNDVFRHITPRLV